MKEEFRKHLQSHSGRNFEINNHGFILGMERSKAFQDKTLFENYVSDVPDFKISF